MTTIHWTLMMISTQVVEMSASTTDKSPSQDCIHLSDQTILSRSQNFKGYKHEACKILKQKELISFLICRNLILHFLKH